MPADHYSYPQYRIIQYAKSPRLGQVKTRLRPALGDAGCLQLHRQLLEYCFHNLSNARVAPYSLSVSGEPCGYFDRLVAHSDVDIQRQQGADLGQRLQHSATQALASADGVIFIGSDCPFIDADYLHRACAALQRGHDCVLGPASDGGYVLIGFRQVRTEMFVDIPWGSGQVLDITRQRLDGLGWNYSELPTLADIDRPQDLSRLGAIWPQWRHYQAGLAAAAGC